MHVYDITTGKHVTRLPFTSCSWQESRNREGGMSVELAMTDVLRDMGARGLLQPWRVIIAYLPAQGPAHAGPLTYVEWSASDRKVTLTVGGGLTLMTKRLVIGRQLAASWRDHSVVVDEQKPAGDLALTLRGPYYRDIACQLVDEALQWGALPITLPGFVRGKGNLTRTYYAWDLGATSDRLTDLTNLENGIEMRFDPRIKDDGSITFDFTATDLPLVDRAATGRWNAVIPDSRIILDSLTDDGADLTSQVWLTGGKDNDRTLMCRRSTDLPQKRGCMFMQSVDTEHTTISVMKALQSHAVSDLRRYAFPAETFKFRVGEEKAPHVGDNIDVTVSDDFIGASTLHVTITDVSGTADSDWVTVGAQERS
mgnify:CR=1 FL=1